MKSSFLLWVGTVTLAALMSVAMQTTAPRTITADDEPPPTELVRLSKTNEIWFDSKRKAVVVDGQVCLREGQLEMFACPKGTN